MLEEREQQKRAERMKGAQILQIQIQQAEQEKIRQAGILDQERQAMLKKMAEIDAQEQKKKQELKERNQQLLKEAAETNAAAIEQKKRKKQEAEEENLRIAAYIAERDRKEQERQDAIDEVTRPHEDTHTAQAHTHTHTHTHTRTHTHRKIGSRPKRQHACEPCSKK